MGNDCLQSAARRGRPAPWSGTIHNLDAVRRAMERVRQSRKCRDAVDDLARPVRYFGLSRFCRRSKQTSLMESARATAKAGASSVMPQRPVSARARRRPCPRRHRTTASEAGDADRDAHGLRVRDLCVEAALMEILEGPPGPLSSAGCVPFAATRRRGRLLVLGEVAPSLKQRVRADCYLFAPEVLSPHRRCSGRTGC